ncbi:MULTISPECIES: T6SS immunity protein Tli4 family protein [Pseudomonas]|uniref:T6SS immunity protein Tli4 family protein n=1 Tax=Pseudomonas TaxID=286 RepID=UPI000B51309A|nr:MULTISPECIES: T6SS immunity protein Tli4 family protein [Pseudomonas]MDP9664117.1 hypothetical protein [Pseudomonas cremoricolorata]MBA1206421.1 hypothetical protein [Pseudomonas fulva]MBA1217057.1 hypothetical protein [Pseudomonas fulva]MDH0572377.1 T6SS immunity protein Tli4 family protein [Pseudomonas fulva]QDC04517.1 hypothetical protein FH041_06000 [Pseudomonas sp. SWI7]
MSGNNWNTHYFGRFQLSLPPGSEIVADYKIFDENLELVSKNGKSQLPVITQRLIEDLEKGVARGTSSKYEKTIQLDNGSVLLLSRLSTLYTLNAYLLTSKNTLYHMMIKRVTPNGVPEAVENMRKLSNAIYFRRPDTEPPHGAFALEAGYSTLPNDQFFESVYMGAQIKGHAGYYVSLLTKSITEKEPSLLERFDQKEYDPVVGELSNRGKLQILRKKKLTVGGIEGEEVAVSTVIDGKTFYAFQFEYDGTLESNTRPYIAIELGTHEIGSNFNSNEEALAFWDELLRGFKPLSE